jgi:hypothetical protein
MVPSFMTWKRTRRSMVSSRKAVRVISFSGSSSKGWAYLAFEQRPNLVLHALCLAQQALVDAQSLEPSLAAAHIVDPCRAVLDCASQEIFRVCFDIVSLGLYCCAPSVLGATNFLWEPYLQ